MRSIPEPFLSRLRKEAATVLAGKEAEQRISEIMHILQTTGATNIDLLNGVMETENADKAEEVQTDQSKGQILS